MDLVIGLIILSVLGLYVFGLLSPLSSKNLNDGRYHRGWSGKGGRAPHWEHLQREEEARRKAQGKNPKTLWRRIKEN